MRRAHQSSSNSRRPSPAEIEHGEFWQHISAPSGLKRSMSQCSRIFCSTGSRLSAPAAVSRTTPEGGSKPRYTAHGGDVCGRSMHDTAFPLRADWQMTSWGYSGVLNPAGSHVVELAWQQKMLTPSNGALLMADETMSWQLAAATKVVHVASRCMRENRKSA